MSDVLSAAWCTAHPERLVCTGFYQLVTKVDVVYKITLTAEVRQLLSTLSIGVSIGLSSTTSVLTCLGLDGFRMELTFWMLAPPVLTGCILLSSVIFLLSKRKLTCTDLAATTLPLCLRMLFLIYPLIANVAFEAFSFYHFPDNGKYYLIKEYRWHGFERGALLLACSFARALTDQRSPSLRGSVSLTHDSEEYSSVFVLAWLAIGVYVFGLLAFHAALLFCARKAILEQKPTMLSTAIHFLYKE